MRKVLFIIICFSAGWCSIPAQPTMTLAECIRTGIERNLTVRQQDISIEKSRLGITQTQARLLPVIGAALGVNDNLVNPVTVTGGTLLGNDFPDDITWQKVRSMQYQGSMSLEASLPLLDLTRTAAISLAREMNSLATMSREQAVETQQENYRLAQDVYAVTMEKYKEGIASMTELLQDEIALRSAYTQCLDAHYQYNVARLSLLRLMGNLDVLTK